MSQPSVEVIVGSRRSVPPPSWAPGAQVVVTPWESSAELENICTGVEAVVHLAGMNAGDCANDPIAAMEVNAVATGRLLRAAVRKGVKRFIFLSTAHVYGSPLMGVVSERTCPASLHPYATSHRAGEDIVWAAHQRREIEGVVIRLSNAFGAPAHPAANCWMLLVNELCRQAVAERRMVLRSSGRQRRDFITITDACRAIRHLLELPAARLEDGLFNLGGNWAPTVLEMTERLADRFAAATGHWPEIIRQSEADGERSVPLEYQTTKIAATGFEWIGDEGVNRELDALIQCCLAAANLPR